MPFARNYIVLDIIKEIVLKQRITCTDINIEPIYTIPHTNLRTFLPFSTMIYSLRYKELLRDKSCVCKWIYDTSILIFLVKENYHKQLLSILNYRIGTNLKNEC